MDFVPLLSTIILVSTIVTLLLTIGSYMAFRFREKRRPRPPEDLPKPKFFRRYLLPVASNTGNDQGRPQS